MTQSVLNTSPTQVPAVGAEKVPSAEVETMMR